ncbi:DUF3311 domain-containing protein [Robbsia sp. Bb-Pol-6]|uniref:DUF3311 domain-containing protein n=1 Tax=Robbsia betulipollinis TaxID=2981849 RepID=A0ABT3ZPV9_9BURK|nr:DUF3311 domain-containing protein [Robbsia betulipollinis]MCY0388588.1 DUF3311 domain-containing protein [Robbsia betulipollinis]
MARSDAPHAKAKHWLWLLLVPYIALMWVPFYNSIEPLLWGFPYFYWYQLLWVVISSAITALVYFKTRPYYRGRRQGGGAQ